VIGTDRLRQRPCVRQAHVDEQAWIERPLIGQPEVIAAKSRSDLDALVREEPRLLDERAEVSGPPREVSLDDHVR
jgi:hypothetical protein